MNFFAFFLGLLFLIPSARAQQAAQQPVQQAVPLPASKLMSLYDEADQAETVTLNKPHRESAQISQWAADRVIAAMTLDMKTWQANAKTIASGFDAYGFQEYGAYLRDSGLFARLQNEGLRVNAIEDGTATLVSEGVLSDTYHWLYQVPLILTYYREDLTSLKTRAPGAAPSTAQNQTVTVRIQIGRTSKAADDMGLVIERWSVLSR